MDYTALLAPLAFLMAVQFSLKLNTGPVFNSIIAVGTPLLASRILAWIMLSGGHNQPSLIDLFPISVIVTTAIQLVVAWFVFSKLQVSEGYDSWIYWALGGGVVVIYVVPMVVGFLL